MVKSSLAVPGLVASLVLVSGSASAQWTATILHPTGATNSWCTGVAGGQQVGVTQFADGLPHASRWTGSTESWLDLNPPDAFYGESTSAVGAKSFRSEVSLTQLRIGKKLRYRKIKTGRVIVGWRKWDFVTIAARSNGGGDPTYADKLAFVANLFPRLKR